MNNREYQKLPCISSSWLKDLLDSPAECYKKHLDPLRQESKPSASMQFGTLVHCLALTPLQFGQEFIIDSISRRTQAGKARYAKLSAAGKIIITPDDFERAQSIVAALKAHPEAKQRLNGGQKEQIFIQEREHGLLPLKARLDIYHHEPRRVSELKTIHDLNKMKKAINRYRYPLSAAFYADISQLLSVHFIFVQTREPFEVETFEMTRLQLQDGREQYQSALRRFDDCWRRNEWPEAEPAVLDDDPLMMDFVPAKAATRQRFELPVGELAL